MIGSSIKTTSIALAPAPAVARERRRRSVRRRATAIQAIGTAVPGPGFAQPELVEFMKRAHAADARLSRLLDILYRRSGIDRRYSCLADYGLTREAFRFFSRNAAGEQPSTARRMAIYRQAATPLAVEAVNAACRRLADFDRREITHLVVASCTGFFAPGIDVDLVTALGLSPRVARTLIGFQGCHAALSSLRVADSTCRADPRATVLVVCVELCTLHFQIVPTEDNLLANSLFADGGCAVLLHSQELDEPERRWAEANRGEANRAGGDSGARRPRLFISRSASWLEADTQGEMAWSVGDHGFEMRLSSLVPRILGLHVERFLEEALGMDADELDALGFWAVHPGGPAILDEIERSLRLDPELLRASRNVLREYGNMSSPTVLFVLERLWREMAENPRPLPEQGVALAFGPGLTLEAILFETRP